MAIGALSIIISYQTLLLNIAQDKVIFQPNGCAEFSLFTSDTYIHFTQKALLLTFTFHWADSADYKLIIFLFFLRE